MLFQRSFGADFEIKIDYCQLKEQGGIVIKNFEQIQKLEPFPEALEDPSLLNLLCYSSDDEESFEESVQQ